MGYPEILVLRHGETEWNSQGRLQGEQDSPLTEVGEQQAARQQAILAQLGPERYVWRSSPQGRAWKTARIALQGADVEIVQDPRLREVEMGRWSGCRRDDLMRDNPGLFEQDGLGWYDLAPDGEGLAALAERCQAVLSDLSVPTGLITHGITSRVLRCLAQGLPWEALDQVGGGQGVVYRIRDGQSELLA